MKSSDSVLIWSFYRHFQPFIWWVTIVAMLACLVAAFFPGTRNHIALYCIVFIGWMLVFRGNSAIAEHHFQVPVSNGRLASLLYLTIFALIFATHFVTFGLMNLLFTANWQLSETALASGVLAGLIVSIATCLRSLFTHDVENPMEGMLGFLVLPFVNLQSWVPALSAEWIHEMRWLLGLVIAIASVYLLKRSLQRIRSGVRTFDQWSKGGLKVEDLFRRTDLHVPSSVADAVFELDWRRGRELFVIVTIVFGLPLILLGLLADAKALIGCWIGLGMLVPALAYFVAGQFRHFDYRQNGEFRWTLPVSDQLLADGLLRAIFSQIVALWSVWLVGLVCACFFVFATSQFQTFHKSPFPVALAVVAVSLPLNWIAATQGVLSSLTHGGCKEMILIALVLSAGPLSVVVMGYLPAEYHVAFGLGVLGFASAYAIWRTTRVFKYAGLMGYVRPEQTNRFILYWTGLVVAATILGYFAGFPWSAMLITMGVGALVFHPLASIPLVMCMNRRSYGYLESDDPAGESIH